MLEIVTLSLSHFVYKLVCVSAMVMLTMMMEASVLERCYCATACLPASQFGEIVTIWVISLLTWEWTFSMNARFFDIQVLYIGWVRFIHV